jgi:hypothetical protein
MSLLRVSVASTEFVEVEVSSSEDPAGLPLEFAFPVSHLLSDDPETVWTDGFWHTDAAGIFWARCLVGPEGMVSPPLGRGLYLMYLRWEQDSEKPAKCAGTLEVY